MGEFKNQYKNSGQKHTGRIEQLMQLTQITWDGDIISKHERDQLVKSGLAQRMPHGFNVITDKGVEVLYDLGLINS